MFTLKRHKNFTDNLQNKVPGKMTNSGLFEQCFWQNLLNFYDKIDLSSQIRIIYDVKHSYAICLKFGGKLLTFLNK